MEANKGTVVVAGAEYPTCYDMGALRSFGRHINAAGPFVAEKTLLECFKAMRDDIRATTFEQQETVAWYIAAVIARAADVAGGECPQFDLGDLEDAVFHEGNLSTLYGRLVVSAANDAPLREDDEQEEEEEARKKKPMVKPGT